MLADGNGDFTRALGLELDGSKFGMGKRSQRFSMVVDNGVVKALNVEEPGAFEVSSAEHICWAPASLADQLARDRGAGQLIGALIFGMAGMACHPDPAGPWWRAMASSSARHRSSFLTGFLSAVFQPLVLPAVHPLRRRRP